MILASSCWETDTPVNVHQIARRFAARGNPVLFAESTGLRSPKLSSGHDMGRIRRRLSDWRDGAKQIEDNLWVLSPLGIPASWGKPFRAISEQMVGRTIRNASEELGMDRPILWSFLPTHLTTAKMIPHRLLVYHCVDHYAANPGVNRNVIEAAEKKMLNEAGLVIATSGVLAQRLRKDRDDVHLLPNVADVELFSRAVTQELEEPEDLRGASHPRLVYVGNLAQYRIDLDLLGALLEAMPEASLILIGVVGSGDTSVDSPELLRLLGHENVHALGAKDQKELPAYLKHCDVALIPFLDNEHTRGSLPLKFWEYVAAGLAVVARDLPNFKEPAQESLVRLASDATEYVEAVRGALGDKPQHKRRRLEAAQSHSWTMRIEELAGLLNSAL